MRENRQIVDRWRKGSASILATLVRVQGSSYRQPGARLIVDTDGTYAGGISAGCLEADLLRKAAWTVRNGAAVERYSTLFDETSDMPFGLGCGGVLDVLLEPTGTTECEALLQAMEATLAGSEHVVATWLPDGTRTMMRGVFRANGQLVFASQGLLDESLSQARDGLFQGSMAQIPGMFLERLVSPQRLIIFGAGDDAKPLVTMAGLLGWSVTVVDGSARLARGERFAGTSAKVSTSPDAVIRAIDAEDAVVLMTHSYEQDSQYLAALLPLRPRYLGLLGSRQRSAHLIAGAAAELEWSVNECCEQVCAPVGLDIGGEGPEAIALAIMAEAQAACAGKRDPSRKLSVEHVARHLANGDAEVYVRAQCALGTA